METEPIGILLQLYSANSSMEANLWMMYVAATLACAGFGVTTNTLTSVRMAVIASIGFIAFAIGQFVMVQEAIEVRRVILDVLRDQVDASHEMKSFINRVGGIGLTLRGAILTHAVVDVCIVALVMFRPMSLIRQEGQPVTT